MDAEIQAKGEGNFSHKRTVGYEHNLDELHANFPAYMTRLDEEQERTQELLQKFDELYEALVIRTSCDAFNLD